MKKLDINSLSSDSKINSSSQYLSSRIYYNNKEFFNNSSINIIVNKKTNLKDTKTKRQLNLASIFTRNSNLRKYISNNGFISNSKLFKASKILTKKNRININNINTSTNKKNMVNSFDLFWKNKKLNDSRINLNLSKNISKIKKNKTIDQIIFNKKTDILSYTYKRLQNKIRKYYSVSRKVNKKENRLLLLATSRNLFNFGLDNEHLFKKTNNIFSRNYDSFYQRDIINLNNTNNKKRFNKLFATHRNNVPVFKNKLIASLTNNKEKYKYNKNKNCSNIDDVFLTASVNDGGVDRGEEGKEYKNMIDKFTNTKNYNKAIYHKKINYMI